MATAPPRGKPMKGDCYVANGRLALDTARGLGPLKKYKDKTKSQKNDTGYKVYFFKPTELPFSQKVNDITVEYIAKYPQLQIQDSSFRLEDMRFKYFRPGNFFKVFHCEQSFELPYRILSFMVYLSDHDEGTEFYSGKVIKSEKGKAIIFPAFWTHLHRGQKCNEDRFIMGGYFNLIKSTS